MGNRIRELRNERNLSLRELAKAVDISPSNLGSLERNEIETSSVKMKALADFFDVSIEYAQGLTDVRKAPDIKLFASLKGEKLEVVEKISDLSEDDLHDLNLMLDILYKTKKG